MQENKDPLKEMAGKMLKKKILMFLAPALPGIFFFFAVAVLVFIIVYPIIKGGQIIEGIAGFWDRVGNALTLKCFFCTTDEYSTKREQVFYKKVEKLNQSYLNGDHLDGTSIQLDIPLLLSTLFYSEDVEAAIEEEANADGTDAENYNEAMSGDLLGNLYWYYDQSDQKAIDWFVGSTEAEGCYIKGYIYEDHEEGILGKSNLRKLAKHMVKRVVNGTCTATYNDDGDFTGWEKNEWYEYVLDIDRNDSTYTMQFDTEPYKSYRDKSEVGTLPSTYTTYLLATYLPTEFGDLLPNYTTKDLSDKHELYLTKRKVMKNVIYSYKSGYEYLVGREFGVGAICGEMNGNCSYNIKDSSNKDVTLSNIKVKLLQCSDGDEGEPIPGESLVDFEKYILGVVYAEDSGAPLEALKAQAIAARGYTLNRGKIMGGKHKIYKENGQWILPMKNCTADQVYCDPDQGCTVKNGSKNETSKTVYSGTISGKTQYKGALGADANERKAVAETTGKVLTDSSGNITNTSYTQTTQNAWTATVNGGGDAYQALVGTYGSENILKANCSGTVGTTINTGSEKYYNQNDYAHVNYCSVGTTLASNGNLPTAYAMLAENLSGTVTTPQNIGEYICNTFGTPIGNDFLTNIEAQNKYKISIKELLSTERGIDSILSKLESGKNILVHISGSGTFATTEGNYVILSSVTSENQIKVLDPRNRNASTYYNTSTIQTEILNKISGGIWEVSSTNNGLGTTSDGCYTGATGDYIAWRQGDSTWKNVPLGSGGATIGSAGCLATSVAKIIAMSATQVTINSFNPGTMVKYLNTHGGFSGSNWIWGGPQNSGLTPNFQHGGSVNLKGMTEVQKISKVKEYLDQGYYLVLQVKCDGTEEPGQHWVAVLGVTNSGIVMSDPASDKTNVWDKYKSGGTVQFHYYKKLD